MNVTSTPALGYTSGYDRLARLPGVFSLATASRMLDMPRQQTLAYLARWRARKWVEPAGPRAGIYFNRIANTQAADVHRTDALLMLYPSAVLIGESVLHAAGWTTQIPSTLQVAVEKTSARRSYKQLDGFTLHPRPLSWFAHAHAQVRSPQKAGFNTYGLPTLSPKFALADLYATPGAWHPDADDLDIPINDQKY